MLQKSLSKSKRTKMSWKERTSRKENEKQPLSEKKEKVTRQLSISVFEATRAARRRERKKGEGRLLRSGTNEERALLRKNAGRSGKPAQATPVRGPVAADGRRVPM